MTTNDDEPKLLRIWPGMPTRRSQYKLSIIFGLVSACLVIGFMVASEFRRANRLAEASAELALLNETGRLLEEHFNQHGTYPQSLDSLAFTFPDGSDETTLSKLQYESDGKSYSLVVQSAYDGEEYTFYDGQVQLRKQ